MPKNNIIREGETLSSIIKAFKANPDQIRKLNPHLEDHIDGELPPGAFLRLPEGSPRVWMRNRRPDIRGGEAPWYEIAQIEENTGIDEIPGHRHNPRILEYHATTTLGASDDETPWCSSFVNWCVKQSGLEGTNSAAARSWLGWGEEIDEPREGAIVIFRRGNNTWQGHVGFYVGDSSATRVLVLGGNQGDQVSYNSYPKSKLLGYRWNQ